MLRSALQELVIIIQFYKGLSSFSVSLPVSCHSFLGVAMVAHLFGSQHAYESSNQGLKSQNYYVLADAI